jgi:hypothetical protein
MVYFVNVTIQYGYKILSSLHDSIFDPPMSYLRGYFLNI